MREVFIQVYYLLVGAVFLLGAYVVSDNLRRYRANKAKLLPLHVWMISVSYLIMVATFLHPNTNYAMSVFVARYIALFLGIYALWTLVKNQRARNN